MEITAKQVNDLREKTGAGMMDCKKALIEANGNVEKAIEILREKGIAKAQKKQSRIAAEGIVDSYIHAGGKVGVLVEVNCETDFVARGDKFRALVHDIALQIAATRPLVVRVEELDKELVAKEREIYKAQVIESGKPANIVDKIVDGMVQKYYKEVVLMEQAFVKDPSKTISDIITEATQTIGEKITIRRFVCFEMGEGLEKRNDDFAKEVAEQASNK